jgi:aminopeptidase N
MKDAAPVLVKLEDYRAPEWRVESLALDFSLDPKETRVSNEMVIRCSDYARSVAPPLRLYGGGFERYSLRLDGRPLPPEQIQEDEEGLWIYGLPESAQLTIETWLCPAANTALEGLYVSGECLCTQCEPEGFRRITFFLDRPDVLSVYRVRLEADCSRFPVLLANGNRVASGDLPGGRHFAVWEDPFPKPSYLFALVAGDLICRSAVFRTRSGRDVQLEVYVESHHGDRCGHALASLARAMRYDEDAFGREYDLDVYMVVAVDDFNMGAMENKGLNLFNAKYVLASPETATDDDYVAIESIIAHEYFHNWSGNRVTCRDWFQLSLKEGLTVFRDQEFTTDCTLKDVKRIDDVQRLRAFQFPEDAGPLAHPVRPDRYSEINNFYTMTVYEKGAELIRMLRTLIGRDRFRAGLDAYFARFDGQAVTIEDFVAVMAEISGRDLGPFMLWYAQAGTPEVVARAEFDPEAGALALTLEQSTPPTPGQSDKKPLVIPLRMAFFAADGTELSAIPASAMSGFLAPESGISEFATPAREVLIELTAARQTFCLQGFSERPAAISWLRGFSAPVRLDAGQSDAELMLLLRHESDGFTRWDCAQQIWRRVILARVGGAVADELESQLAQVLEDLLVAKDIEPVLLAALLEPPSHRELMEGLAYGDPVALDGAIRAAEKATFARVLPLLGERLDRLDGLDNASFVAAEMGKRRLSRRLLAVLVAVDPEQGLARAMAQYRTAASQTLRMGALHAINPCAHPIREELLADFEARFRNDPVVLDKWLGLQASSQIGGGLERIERLFEHPGFRWTNPNRVRAVIGPFMAQNHALFHAVDGSGYRWVMRWLEHLERINPQTAARLVQPFARWRRLETQRSAQMHSVLEPVLQREDLSRDFRDVLFRVLASPQTGVTAGQDGS